MKKEHQIILDLLQKYLAANPSQRFGQALINLKINEFQKTSDPKYYHSSLRINHNDQDQVIIDRIHEQLAWFALQKEVFAKTENITGLEGMTIEERLAATGLTKIFAKIKESNVDYAQYVLRLLKVDMDTIGDYFDKK